MKGSARATFTHSYGPAISDPVTDRLYFAFVELVRDGDECVLDPDMAGAFTHVAARAANKRAFLESVTEAAGQLGLLVHDVEWLCGVNSLSPRQLRSGYYHALAAQLSDEPVAWAEFQCYPATDE
jgi:hypothetical protein